MLKFYTKFVCMNEWKSGWSYNLSEIIMLLRVALFDILYRYHSVVIHAIIWTCLFIIFTGQQKYICAFVMLKGFLFITTIIDKTIFRHLLSFISIFFDPWTMLFPDVGKILVYWGQDYNIRSLEQCKYKLYTRRNSFRVIMYLVWILKGGTV